MTSSFVHHFKAIGEFTLEFLSRNTQFGSKSAILFHMWPWKQMDDLGKQWGTSCMSHQALCFVSQPSVNSNLSYSPETPNLGQNGRFFEPRDLEIWRMTLKKNRTPLLRNIKVYASFHHHMWIQTGVTARKRQSLVMISVTLAFDLWPWPSHGRHFCHW